jgi:hypothetical protein
MAKSTNDKQPDPGAGLAATVSYCPFCLRSGKSIKECTRRVLPCPPVKVVPKEEVIEMIVERKDGSLHTFAADAKKVARALKLPGNSEPHSKVYRGG